MEAYKRWVWKNREFVHSLESLANGLTWFLPERFSESEIGPEAVTSIFGIITGINQYIIDQAAAQFQKGVPEHGFPWSLCISTVKDLETLVEVVAQQYFGDDKKWNFILIMEAIKALIKLKMFSKSSFKMLLSAGLSSNGEESVDSSANNSTMYPANGWPSSYQRPGQVHDFRSYNRYTKEGRAMAALSRFAEDAKTSYRPIWTNQSQYHQVTKSFVIPSKQITAPMNSSKRPCSRAFIFGEVLYIIRPFIYVLFIRRYGIRSWLPWLVSLAVDFAAIGTLSFITNPLGKDKRVPHVEISEAEKDEIKRRKMLLAFYVMRDPFFRNYARSRLENTEKVLDPIPFIGILTSKVVELIVGAQTRYTYTSAS